MNLSEEDRDLVIELEHNMMEDKSNPMNIEDRISKLPDPILTKILSFLELKQAIHTSILSKRWKPLWTSLEDFDFDFNKHRRETDPFSAWHSREIEQATLIPYIRFVNRVLSNRDDSIKIGKFRLSFDLNVDPVFIQDCIQYAVSHNVEDLDLAAYHDPKPFQFPPSFCYSQSLHKLRLKDYSQSMIIPKPFCLPSLKILYLERFPFKDDDDFCFPKEPFSSFPNLQELTLNCCSVDGLMILAPELKVLELNFRGYQPQFSSESKIEKAAMPKLESFKFEGQVSLVCPMEDLPCLNTVYIDLYPLLEDPYTNEVKKKMPINLFKLLEQLKFTKSLTLSFTTIQVLSMDSGVLLQKCTSPFVNLKYLKFIRHLGEEASGLFTENVMAYLTDASSFSDSMIVKYPET